MVAVTAAASTSSHSTRRVSACLYSSAAAAKSLHPSPGTPNQHASSHTTALAEMLMWGSGESAHPRPSVSTPRW